VGITVKKVAEMASALAEAQRLNADGQTVLIDVHSNMEANLLGSDGCLALVYSWIQPQRTQRAQRKKALTLCSLWCRNESDSEQRFCHRVQSSNARSEFRNNPRPPAASTRMVIRSNPLMERKLNCTEEITPKINATREPPDSSHPMGFLAL